MNVILFGFKSCGKTTLGRLLAEKMERRFIDTDEIVRTLFREEHQWALTPREIYQLLGEEEFRALERRAIKAVQEEQNAIIAVGGGAVLSPENVQALQKIGLLIYLEADPETLRRRILRDDLSAFLTGEEEELNELIRTRTPIYEGINAKRVNVDLLDEATIVTALRTIVILQDQMDFFPRVE